MERRGGGSRWWNLFPGRKTDDDKTKDAVINALRQRRSEAGVKIMIELARAEKNLELKKKLVFWLGQSKSEEAAKFLRELLEK